MDKLLLFWSNVNRFGIDKILIACIIFSAYSQAHLHLSLLVHHILLSKLIYLMPHTHFCLFLLHSFSLHLCDSGSFHLLKPLFHRFLGHPHFVILGIVLPSKLLPCFTVYFVLPAYVSLLGYFIRFIELFLGQPLFHLVYTRVMEKLLSLCVPKQFLPDLPLGLVD